MRTAPALLLLAVGLGCNTPHPPPAQPAPAPEPAPVAEPPVSVAAPEPATAHAPRPAQAIRTTDGAVPKDFSVRVEHPSPWTFRVGVARSGFLVALRRGQERAAGNSVAHIGTTGEPIVWETTQLDTLETTRGTIEVDEGGKPRVALAEPPATAAEETRLGHRCRAHEDGAGGFAVVCRVGTLIAVRNLAGGPPLAGVTTAHRDEATFLRFNLPAQAGHPDAFAAAYAYRSAHVVLRAEASLVPGEERPALALLSAERDQPVQPVMRFGRPMPRREMPVVDLEF